MEREDYVRHFGFTLDEYTKRFGFDKMFKAMEDRIMHLEEMGNNKDRIMKAQDECIETKKRNNTTTGKTIGLFTGIADSKGGTKQRGCKP